MGNIFDLKEGMLFSIKLNENAWTLGQFCNVFRLESRRYAQYTVAFFNYLYASKQALKENMETGFKANPS